MKMNQPGTDKGERKGETGEREPAGVAKRDLTGQRKRSVIAGVGQGMHDRITGRESGHLGKQEGLVGEFNDGHQGERTVYEHQRIPHEQDK